MPILRWGEVAWPQIDALDRKKTVAVLPLGAVEAHGPHLPLVTDGVIAEAMAESAADGLGAGWTIAVLPTLHYSSAPFAEAFAGTISLRPETVTEMIVDIGRSVAAHGIGCFAIANAHLDPAHLGSIARAVELLRADPDLRVAFPNLTRKPWVLRLTQEFKSGACHAGRFEGSIVLATRPDWVHDEERLGLSPNPSSIADAIRAGKTSFAEAGGSQAYFGDPAAATAAEGRRTIATLGEILAESIEAALTPA